MGKKNIKEEEEKKKIKEKDIIDHLIANWEEYFPHFDKRRRKEFTFRNSRVDILSSITREEDNTKHDAIFMEVKYSGNDRDLLYELEKHIAFRDFYIKAGGMVYIVVLSDNFDKHMISYMEENYITMYLYKIEDNDLNTLTIEEYEPINS